MVVYSNMSAEDIQRTSNYLKDNIDITKLSLLKPAAFAKAIGEIYVQLDYLHPSQTAIAEQYENLHEICLTIVATILTGVNLY